MNDIRNLDAFRASRVSGLGHYVWDTVDDKCLQCSQEHAALHGLSVEDYIASASTLNGLAHPDDLELVRKAFMDLRKGETFQIEYRICLPDGSVRFVREIGHPIFDNAGQVVREIGTSQDISNEIKLKADIRASEQRYKDLFEQSPIPFMEENWAEVLQRLQKLDCDSKGAFLAYFERHPDEVRALYDACQTIKISTKFAELYGAKTIEELHPFLKFEKADTDEVTRFLEALIKFYFGETQVSYKAKETKLNGKEIATRITFSLPAQTGSPWERVLISAEDITEEQELELALGRAQHFEALGKISGRIAHDFNNLLMIVRAGAEVALMADDHHSEEIFTEIISATERGAALTSQMLSYAGTQKTKPEIIDAVQAITDMQLLLRSALGTSIQFKVHVVQSNLMIFVDPGLLKDAVMNLLINARDSMPQGGTLNITIKSTALANYVAVERGGAPVLQHVEICVSDTGCGMPTTTLEKAIEPFFTTKSEGTGLGLSSVYGFTRQANGTLNIRSVEGKGTSVSILLPLVGEIHPEVA